MFSEVSPISSVFFLIRLYIYIYICILLVQSFKLFLFLFFFFLVQHRGERRGLGGIFFDDLSDYDQEMLLSFATSNNCLLFCYSLLRKEPFFLLMKQLEEVYVTCNFNGQN